MQALLINGSKKFGNDGTRLNTTLQGIAKEVLESKGYKVLETIIDNGYNTQIRFDANAINRINETNYVNNFLKRVQ